MELEHNLASSEAHPVDPAQELLERHLPTDVALPDYEASPAVFAVSTNKRLGDLGASLILAGVLGFGAWLTWPELGWLFALLSAYVLSLAPRYFIRLFTVIHVYQDHLVQTVGKRKRRIDFDGLEALPPKKRNWIPRDLVPLKLRQGGQTFRFMAPDFTDGRHLPRERFLEALLARGVKVDYPGFQRQALVGDRQEVWIRTKDPSPVVDGLLTIFLTLSIFVFGIAAWLIPAVESVAPLVFFLLVGLGLIGFRWRRRANMACLVYEAGGLWLFKKKQVMWEAPAGQVKGLVIETRARLLHAPEHRICALTLYGRRYPITSWTWRHTVAREEVLELARSVGLPIIYDEGSEEGPLQQI